MIKRLSAEAFGTFWLVFGGCGSAVLAAAFPDLGIGFVGVSLAFGLTVLTGAYAFGPVSGGHFNPAVSVGLAVAGRFRWSELAGYVVAQVLGAVVAGAVLYQIAMGKAGFQPGGFASNGWGEHSPGGYNMAAALLTGVVQAPAAVFIGGQPVPAPPWDAPHLEFDVASVKTNKSGPTMMAMRTLPLRPAAIALTFSRACSRLVNSRRMS